MTIATYVDEDTSLFDQMKNKTSRTWHFLLTGEWSQSPYHQGKVEFHYRNTNNLRDWAILSIGFPKRIAVVATFDQPTEIEEACSIMLKVLKIRRREFLDCIDETGDFDYERFEEAV
jgi:hypothetical protein